MTDAFLNYDIYFSLVIFADFNLPDLLIKYVGCTQVMTNTCFVIRKSICSHLISLEIKKCCLIQFLNALKFH